MHPGTAHQDSATHTRRDQEDDDGGQQGGGAEAPDAAAMACDAGEGHGEVRGHAQNSSRLGANILENTLHVFSHNDDNDDHYVVSVFCGRWNGCASEIAPGFDSGSPKGGSHHVSLQGANPESTNVPRQCFSRRFLPKAELSFFRLYKKYRNPLPVIALGLALSETDVS